MARRVLRDRLKLALKSASLTDELLGWLVPTTGSVFYVDSVTGDDDDTGLSPQSAVATLNVAIAKCTANKGDVIYVMPGHNEVATAIDLDVAGISVIGLGNGVDRPRFDYDATTDLISIGANGVRLSNVTLLPSVAVVAIGIDVEAAVTDTLLEDIEFLPGEAGDGTDEFVLGIDVKAGCSRTRIRGLRYRHHASANGAASAVKFTGASDDCTVEDFDIWITGAAAVAGINGDTTLSTRLTIRDGRIASDAEPGIELLTGTTGIIEDVRIFSDLATIDAAIVADGMAAFDCKYVEVGGEAGTLIFTESVDD